MTIEIYNTLTRRKEPLRPIEPGKLRMYVCGVTTYDLTHIGHGRTFVAFDVMQRWLRARGIAVVEVERTYSRPRGILWDHLQPPQIHEIPILERMGYA